VKRGPSSLDPTGHRYGGGFTRGEAIFPRREAAEGSEAHLPTTSTAVERVRPPSRAIRFSPRLDDTGAHEHGLRVSGLGIAAPL
jgi:hypothetical protein